MPLTTDDPADVTFSEAIRMATAGAHRDAERNGFLGRLLAGDLPIAAYGRLIVQHLAVYEALEGWNAAMADDPVAAAFVRDEIVRLPALETDVVAVLGADWQQRSEAELVPATVAYCARLQHVGAHWPNGWIAHQYVRYLGDLSGGFHIGARLEEVFDIDSHSGTAFYDFPDVEDPVAWKDAYRERLDRAPWNLAEQEKIVDEILDAYRFNTDIFAELSERCDG